MAHPSSALRTAKPLKPVTPDFTWTTTLLVVRSTNTPRGYIGYSPEIGVVSQGPTPLRALKCVKEAVCLLLEDDLTHDLNPLKRRARHLLPGPTLIEQTTTFVANRGANDKFYARADA